MAKTKSKFKVGDKFFHPTQDLFVIIDDTSFYPGKGWLYTLKCYNPGTKKTEFWKRYYETKIINELSQIKVVNTAKVLYG